MQDTIAELARLLEKVLEDQDLRNALIVLVGQLCQDKEVLASVMGLVVKLAGEPHVTEVSYSLPVAFIVCC